jgi:hypothetical protein
MSRSRRHIYIRASGATIPEEFRVVRLLVTHHREGKVGVVRKMSHEFLH